MRANKLPEVTFRQAIDDAPDAGPVGGAGAHRTGFGAGIHRAAGQECRRIGEAGPRHQHPFGVAGAVAGVAMRVSSLHQDSAVGPDQDRAKWVIARGPRLAGDVEREAEIGLVGV